MKKGLFIFAFFILVSCSTKEDKNTSLEGTWVWENANIVGSKVLLKKHLLVIQGENYQETFFENTLPIVSQEGALIVTRNDKNIEFSTKSEITTVYVGMGLDKGLIITSINGETLTPPALYKKIDKY